jgi:small acid-soluble spore protein H (minor)
MKENTRENMEVMKMNAQRAQEIAASSVMANVTYNGVPVYIQRVNQQKETARIYPLDQPQNEQEVPLSSLQEN